MNGKRGDILVSNIVFIILNIIFITILLLFVFSKSGNDALLEEKYAKKIVMMINSAKPGMTIIINVEDAIESTEKNGFDKNQMISITGNSVNVKLRDKGGQSYSFFNDVSVSTYFNGDNPDEYVIKIGDYK